MTPEMERDYEQMVQRLKQESPMGPRRIGFMVGDEGAEPDAIAARRGAGSGS